MSVSISQSFIVEILKKLMYYLYLPWRSSIVVDSRNALSGHSFGNKVPYHDGGETLMGVCHAAETLASVRPAPFAS